MYCLIIIMFIFVCICLLESLQPCKKCGRADAFFIGPLNFQDIIADRVRAEEERRRRRDTAVRVLQRSYKAYLRRVYGASYSLAYIAHRRLLNKAASRMTALIRGRFARRQAKTERCLRIIQFAHPLLLKHALKVSPTRSQCFWYNRQVDVDYLFADYTELCEKTGYIPPRMFVELNIKEISVRIVARQSELLTLIQRAWRGVMGRRMVKILKSEMTRLYQTNILRIMKMQRAYRGHFARLQFPKFQSVRDREKVMDDYLKFSESKLTKYNRHAQHEKSLIYYKKERRDETTARCTSRLMPMECYDNKKLAAFEDSCYYDVRGQINNNMVMSLEEHAIFNRKQEIQRELDRREFILARRAEHGPRGYGMRGFTAEIDLKSKTQHGFLSGDVIIESSRSRSMRLYFEKDLKEIVDHMIERAQHSFKRGGNTGLYKEYNAEKPLHIMLRPIDRLARAEKGGIVSSSSANRKSRVDNKSQSNPDGANSEIKSSSSNSIAEFVRQREKEAVAKSNDLSDEVIDKIVESELKNRDGMVKSCEKLSFATGKERLDHRNKHKNHKYRAFKYPKDINEDPLAWLEDDLDILVKFKNQKLETERSLINAKQDEDIKNRVGR